MPVLTKTELKSWPLYGCRYWSRRSCNIFPLAFMTPGSFSPPGRVILQLSSGRSGLAASHKIAVALAKLGSGELPSRVPPKRVNHNWLHSSPIIWWFLGPTELKADVISLLAVKFGVSQSTITDIRKRRSWSHVWCENAFR